MAHGYLGDGYGTHGEIDPDSDADRDRMHRNDEGRDRASRERPDWDDRDRGFAFGADHTRRGGRDWRDDQAQRWPQNRWPEQRGRADSYNRQAEDWSGQHRPSAHPDDHYRSWRDRHMSELDRDYEEYCRECEQQFHRDFDSWRQNRGQRDNGTKAAAAETGELELTQDRALAGQGNTPSPIDAATLGTNNSANTIIGRGNKQR
ncbi:MAG TPA: hypothetical protein VFK28_01350 [Sphingomicrobium sp.]|jgi:hypothetical protein|nr:hypothetical protein [Sphingomicrobium sp.]